MRVKLSERYANFDTKVPDILSWARGGVINMAGGIPDPSTILPEIADITMEVVKQRGASAFQYGDSQGLPELRDEVVRLKGFGDPGGVVITVGSQEGLDLIGKAFLGPHDAVAVEDPTYFVALPAFRIYASRVVPIPLTEEGLDLDRLEAAARAGLRLLYLMPSLQNPTGRVMSLEERKAVLELAERYDFQVVEDDPYSPLAVSELPPSMARLGGDRVIHLSTFSKTIAPGLRIGFIMTTNEAAAALTNVKSATTISTPPITQLIAAEFLRRGLMAKSIERARRLYWEKLTAVSEALRSSGVPFQEPVGGFFIWLNAGVDAEELLRTALRLGAAFMPGRFFSVSSGFATWLRLSVSQTTVEEARRGVELLLEAIELTKK